ncbi:MAG: hypothetical protein SFX73_02100 [Kofleriaceae bacterium]|nr:hypothetical protein [Kofleriaceae bacterium]
MRFCPFCSAENADDQAACASCGRRLPPLPPRRARNAPASGVQLPPRAPSPSLPPRKTGPTTPPPMGPTPGQPGVMVSPGAQHARPGSHAELDAPGQRAGTYDETTTVDSLAAPAEPTDTESDRRALLAAISPGPSALRREVAPPSERDTDGRARRASDPPPLPPRSKPTTVPPLGAIATQPMTPAAIATSASTTLPRPKTPSAPPPPPAPIASAPRTKAPSTPPPPPKPAAVPPVTEEAKLAIEAVSLPARTGDSPPPTRIQAAERPFTPPQVYPVPEVPEPGLVNAAKYALSFGRARFQRRGAIKTLHTEIKQDTEALDQVLGALGRTARQRRVEGRVFLAENQGINAAEERIAVLTKEHGDVELRKAEENSKFVDIERERNEKLSEAEKLVDESSSELSHLEGQRRALREQRKDLERRQKAYLRSAEDNERQAGSAQMGDTRADLRRAAEQFRRDAAAMEPERQDVDRKLAGLERPIGEATAKLDAAKAELDAAKRSLGDAREGHNHRLAELDAEQKRKSREIGTAESEIARRLVTLGTLVNLNRIDDPAFAELYERIDRLRSAITARTTEIEKLTAEREAYDRGTLVRGVSAIGGAIVAFIALIVILRAIL